MMMTTTTTLGRAHGHHETLSTLYCMPGVADHLRPVLDVVLLGYRIYTRAVSRSIIPTLQRSSSLDGIESASLFKRPLCTANTHTPIATGSGTHLRPAERNDQRDPARVHLTLILSSNMILDTCPLGRVRELPYAVATYLPYTRPLP